MASEKSRDLFAAMLAYSKSIYLNLQDLCLLEQSGKKNEAAYFNTLKNLKELLSNETHFYTRNIKDIYDNRGELIYLVVNNGSLEDLSMFDFLSTFNESVVYERIRNRIKYNIGLEKTFGNDLLSGLKINYYDERNVSVTFLDDSFLTDMQKLSLFYMEHDCEDKTRAIEYKYLSAMIFNIDRELADNYFETSNTNIYLNSTLTYCLNGRYYEMYIIDLTDVLINKFNEFVDYIVMLDTSKEEDGNYKTEIALAEMKSIMDLFPVDIKAEFYNDFIMGLSDDFSISNKIKLRIINGMNQADRGRRLINYVLVGDKDWNK